MSGAKESEENVNWYTNYYAQVWYQNTFLVSKPDEISYRNCPHELNNIHDSGCNFTCLSMMVGIDPARLSSLLGKTDFFEKDTDRGYAARNLAKKPCRFVWDQNRPNEDYKTVTTPMFWHPAHNKRVKSTISFVKPDVTKDIKIAIEIVSEAKRNGHHVICGPYTHSHLVAGLRNGEFFVWDPNPRDESTDGTWSLADILAGKATLKRLFNTNKGKEIEFWRFKVAIR